MATTHPTPAARMAAEHATAVAALDAAINDAAEARRLCAERKTKLGAMRDEINAAAMADAFGNDNAHDPIYISGLHSSVRALECTERYDLQSFAALDAIITTCRLDVARTKPSTTSAASSSEESVASAASSAEESSASSASSSEESAASAASVASSISAASSAEESAASSASDASSAEESADSMHFADINADTQVATITDVVAKMTPLIVATGSSGGANVCFMCDATHTTAIARAKCVERVNVEAMITCIIDNPELGKVLATSLFDDLQMSLLFTVECDAARARSLPPSAASLFREGKKACVGCRTVYEFRQGKYHERWGGCSVRHVGLCVWRAFASMAQPKCMAVTKTLNKNIRLRLSAMNVDVPSAVVPMPIHTASPKRTAPIIEEFVVEEAAPQPKRRRGERSNKNIVALAADCSDTIDRFISDLRSLGSSKERASRQSTEAPRLVFDATSVMGAASFVLAQSGDSIILDNTPILLEAALYRLFTEATGNAPLDDELGRFAQSGHVMYSSIEDSETSSEDVGAFNAFGYESADESVVETAAAPSESSAIIAFMSRRMDELERRLIDRVDESDSVSREQFNELKARFITTTDELASVREQLTTMTREREQVPANGSMLADIGLPSETVSPMSLTTKKKKKKFVVEETSPTNLARIDATARDLFGKEDREYGLWENLRDGTMVD